MWTIYFSKFAPEYSQHLDLHERSSKWKKSLKSLFTTGAWSVCSGWLLKHSSAWRLTGKGSHVSYPLKTHMKRLRVKEKLWLFLYLIYLVMQLKRGVLFCKIVLSGQSRNRFSDLCFHRWSSHPSQITWIWIVLLFFQSSQIRTFPSCGTQWEPKQISLHPGADMAEKITKSKDGSQLLYPRIIFLKSGLCRLCRF